MRRIGIKFTTLQNIISLCILCFQITDACGGRLDINRASKRDFEKLKGCGPELAKRIVEYRRNNGPFQKIEDLTKVQGIGLRWLKLNEEHLKVTDLFRRDRRYIPREDSNEKDVTRKDDSKKKEPLCPRITMNGGVTIKGETPIMPGDRVSKVMKTLKGTVKDKEVKDKLVDCMRSQLCTLFFMNLGMEIQLLNGMVYEVNCNRYFQGSVGGVRIGDEREAVHKMLGRLQSETKLHEVYNYRGNDIGITYAHSDNKVETITLYDKNRRNAAGDIRYKRKVKRDRLQKILKID